MEWYWIVLLCVGWFVGWTTSAVLICRDLGLDEEWWIAFTSLFWPILLPFQIVEWIVKTIVKE